jgi:hypothetical protein
MTSEELEPGQPAMREKRWEAKHRIMASECQEGHCTRAGARGAVA